MNKLVGIIDSLDYNELKLIQKDLIEGNLAKLINARLKDFENKKESFCPICGSELNEENAKFILIFDTSSSKKKAFFDEIDCLSFFIEKLKNNLYKNKN
ncbi:MAG: hypothetical protein QXR96_01100 [Candidatus Woesearchaeota archaeon]